MIVSSIGIRRLSAAISGGVGNPGRPSNQVVGGFKSLEHIYRFEEIVIIRVEAMIEHAPNMVVKNSAAPPMRLTEGLFSNSLGEEGLG